MTHTEIATIKMLIAYQIPKDSTESRKLAYAEMSDFQKGKYSACLDIAKGIASQLELGADFYADIGF